MMAADIESRESAQAGDDCPACGKVTSHLLDWSFSGLGDSVFNYRADFHHCPTCGLVYVRNMDDATLARFYVDECSYFEKPHFAINDAANQEKCAFYEGFLRRHGLHDTDMADVGCGRGGFVSWLGQKGWRGECWGVDVDVRSIPSQASGNAAFKTGQALALPFGDASLGLLSYFHVLEHIRDLRGLLAEAARVLRPGGHILIEVPDAEQYGEHPVGPAFWLSIREHIYHFTPRALAAALLATGFQVVEVARQVLPTPEFVYPSLMILAHKQVHPVPAHLPPPGDVGDFAVRSRQSLQEQARCIAELAKDSPLTVWGCSAELFSLLPLLSLDRIRLCDASPRKQSAQYHGHPIEDPAAVPAAGLLVVAPYLHRTAIKAAALKLGWPEDAIYLLQ